MIPKTIHYCWFGKKDKPKKAKACIRSWSVHCPDYKIVEWNEDNFDVNYNEYTKFCFENEKWAFLSDFVRLLVVYEHGGIYFDTDVEVIKSFDELLNTEAFYGFENDEFVATGLGFGAVKGHKTVKSMIDEYLQLVPLQDGTFPLISCPQLNTKALKAYGLKTNGEKQMIEGAVILPVDYLNPYDDPTGVLRKSKNTLSIHWYSKSWLDKKAIVRSTITKPFHRLFGVDCFKWLKKK